MESYEKESLRRIRRNSQMLLQDLFSCHRGGGDTPLDDLKVRSRSANKDDVYLPTIARKASSLASIRGNLSQSCPLLNTRRRGSFSSVGSQKTAGRSNKQSDLNAQREAKKSNVTVTMTYLGRGRWGSMRSNRDELKVLQQVNGGENICVFKGLVTPGELFNFISQRHRGFPFSASLYVNGIKVARISACCEYRYAPGFQQGKKSCFRLSWLAGGMPCHRCTSLRSKCSSFQQLNNSTKESLVLPLVHGSGTGSNVAAVESCPSSPQFIPTKPETKSARRTRRHAKDKAGGSTDSEDPPAPAMKETSKKRRREGQTHQSTSKGKTATSTRRDGEGSPGSTLSPKYEGQVSSARQEPQQRKEITGAGEARRTRKPNISKTGNVLDRLQDEEVLTKQKREKRWESNGKSRDGDGRTDFYEQCVQMSAELEKSPSKHNRFQANMLQRRRLQKRLSLEPKAPSSDAEHSEESDAVFRPDGEPDKDEEGKGEEEEEEAGEKEPVHEQDLQAQLEAMITVLSTSDEVEQLVLRNTDLTDDLLLTVAGALKSSSSEVALLNLNLNLIGPYGAHILLDVLTAKPQVKGLHLFGNRLHDHGAVALLSGIAELQEQTSRAAAAIRQQQKLPQQAAGNLTTGGSSFKMFSLLELDIGGNNLSGVGVKVLASYMRHHSHLQYLGLAQTGGADLGAWKELFDSLKGNSSLAQIILDENNLGDPGVRLLADVLKANACLRMVDLDGNGISDVGGNDIMAALLCRGQFPMRHLSLAENNISSGLMSRIQEEVKFKLIEE
ncbi:uncharacterized protein LOC144048407 [Vanacampus margaritifer]